MTVLPLITDDIERGATLSADGVYRYRLWRRWASGDRTVVWAMLNPSTADAATDDATIRRCIGFSRRWGFAGLEVVNLYALRATTPRELLAADDPEGPDNEAAWGAVVGDAQGPIICAWGAYDYRRLPMSQAKHRFALGPWIDEQWRCLGRTLSGFPRHPSRLPYATDLEPW